MSPSHRFVSLVLMLGLLQSWVPPAGSAGNQDPQDFTSEAAKKAASKFREQLAELDKDYAAKKKKLVEQYGKELEEARKAALAKSDLDEAQRALKAKEEMQQEIARPVPRPGFDVITARWGALSYWIDVTTPVRAKVRDGELSLVPERLGFPDPIDGTRKSLVVLYTRDGRTDLAIVADDQPLRLPPR